MRQGLVEKSQEPMLMGSWLLPAVETRETRALAGAASCTGPVFTAFRNAFSSLTGGALQRIRRGFQRVSKRVELGGGRWVAQIGRAQCNSSAANLRRQPGGV